MEAPKRDEVCAPFVISDIPDYKSPIDGKVIGSRSAQREDLKKNDCYLLPPRKPVFKNPRFAKKHGLPLTEGD